MVIGDQANQLIVGPGGPGLFLQASGGSLTKSVCAIAGVVRPAMVVVRPKPSAAHGVMVRADEPQVW